MKGLSRLCVLFSLVISFFDLPSFLLAYSSPGKSTGFVNDFAHVLTVEQKNILEQKLSAFNASTSNEIAVVTIKSLEGDYIENYAVKLFEEWGIGKGKYDNGVLLLVAVEDHRMKIEVGYGLEGALTDALSAQIIRNDLTPAFKQNDFYGGIKKAVDSIIKVTQGEYVADGNSSLSKSFGFPFEAIIFFGFIILQFLASILGRSKSWWLGGVLGGVIGGVVTFFGILGITFGVGVVIMVVLTLLGLLFDYIVSNTYSQSVRSGGGIPWWIGGGSGRGGGPSFGGFGGGRSGGGGVSGSW